MLHDDDWLTFGGADGNTKKLPTALGQRQPPRYLEMIREVEPVICSAKG